MSSKCLRERSAPEDEGRKIDEADDLDNHAENQEGQRGMLIAWRDELDEERDVKKDGLGVHQADDERRAKRIPAAPGSRCDLLDLAVIRCTTPQPA